MNKIQFGAPQNGGIPNINPNIVNNPNSFDAQKFTQELNKKSSEFDFLNPRGFIKQSIKNIYGVDFQRHNNTYNRNTSNFNLDKLYFLTHNLRSNMEKNAKKINNSPIVNIEDINSKYNTQKFEQVFNNFLIKEKDYYREFEDKFGKIEYNNLKNVDMDMKKKKEISLYYMQENPDFDFNNNKMGIYLLLQQDGYSGKMYENPKQRDINKYYRKNANYRIRKEQQKKQKNENIQINNQKNININNTSILSSSYSNMTVQPLSQKVNYLMEEENNLFDKYFNGFIPYFRDIISKKNLTIKDKMFKLREVLDNHIKIFREGRKNFCEFLKRIMSDVEKNGRFTTKSILINVIKFLEEDYLRKNFRNPNELKYIQKDVFITNFTNDIIYTNFYDIINGPQGNSIILWAKIFYYLRFGWKEECIEFIKANEGQFKNESGLREMKDSLNENQKIKKSEFEEFKTIIQQQGKEKNPFKHACMVYISKISEPLYPNILMEINDHLWFNLNLICPNDNYKDILIKNNIIDDEIDTSSNKNLGYEQGLELIKLKKLQEFFESIDERNIINSKDKNTNFVYIILMSSLLKFKTALSFMVKNNMLIDAINYYFILQQLGICYNFVEIDDTEINMSKNVLIEHSNETNEIYQIYGQISADTPSIMLYIIFSNINFVKPLSLFLIQKEEFGILDNYKNNMPLFKNKKDEQMQTFNACLKDIMDEKTLKKVCKSIFELLQIYKVKEDFNLNPLFNIFSEMEMLTELVGILIIKSLEILNLKKPIIKYIDFQNTRFMVQLQDDNNKKLLGQSKILNYFGGLLKDAEKIFNKKQNDIEINKAKNNNQEYNNIIFGLYNELDNNKIPLDILKQLPIIEEIYELIFIGNFESALAIFFKYIDFVQVGFGVENYMKDIDNFFYQIFKKFKYGLTEFYPDVLYIFIWLIRINMIELRQKGDKNNFILGMKENCKILQALLDKLISVGHNDNNLMNKSDIIKRAQNEMIEIQKFYQNS